MAANPLTDKRQRRHTLYLAISALVILACLYLFSAGRDRHTLGQLKEQIAEATQQADRRKMLQPIIESLQKKEQTAADYEEEPQDALALLSDAAEDYPATLETMAQQCDLSLTALTPDIASILSEEGYILVDMTTRGAFSDFRRLILHLSGLPYLEGVDRFQVASDADASELEMQLRLRIALSSDMGGPLANQ